MPNNGYFDTIFAEDGSLSSVPDATQPNGTVSYQQGYGILYSTPVASGGYNFPRAQHNQVLNDITTAIQGLQQNGCFQFITSSMNGGSPFSYARGAEVLYGGSAYRSLVDGNADTPPSAKWQLLDANSTSAVTGANHTYAAADNATLVLRSNSGSPMVDTLPGTGSGVLGSWWVATVANNDASALLQLVAASGANLNGSNPGSIILGPGQRATIVSDGANYYTQAGGAGRVRLGANTNFYVATTGSDSNNNGLSAGSAWATIQHAVSYLLNNVDMNDFTATVNVAAGTYAPLSVDGAFTGAGVVQLSGDATTPSNCVIQASTAASSVQLSGGALLSCRGFKLTTTGSGFHAAQVSGGAQLTINGGMEFGAVTAGNSHLVANGLGQINVNANYAITGGGKSHFNVFNKGVITVNAANTVTVTGTPAFSGAFAISADSTIYTPGTTFSGAATGGRYAVSVNGVINTNGGGASYYPGNAAGTSATGGQYV